MNERPSIYFYNGVMFFFFFQNGLIWKSKMSEWLFLYRKKILLLRNQTLFCCIYFAQRKTPCLHVTQKRQMEYCIKGNSNTYIEWRQCKQRLTTIIDNKDKIIIIHKYRKWESISFEDFLDIKQLILDAQKEHSNILVRLKNVCKIHLDVLHSWYTKGLIKKNIYI